MLFNVGKFFILGFQGILKKCPFNTGDCQCLRQVLLGKKKKKNVCLGFPDST